MNETNKNTNKEKNERKRKEKESYTRYNINIGIGCITDEELYLCIKKKDVSTKNFILNETSIRIADPKASIEFYTGVLGMTLFTWEHDANSRSSFFVIGFDDGKMPKNKEKVGPWSLGRTGNIELNHSWDSPINRTKYHSGSISPNAFGHFGITVPHLMSAFRRFERLGCETKMCEGDDRLFYVLDPDGYHIEIYDKNWH